MLTAASASSCMRIIRNTSIELVTKIKLLEIIWSLDIICSRARITLLGGSKEFKIPNCLLEAAVRARSPDIVRLFLNFDVDVNVKKGEFTNLMFASCNRDHDIASRNRHYDIATDIDILKLLLDNGVNIQDDNRILYTAVHYQFRIEVVELLLRYDAPITLSCLCMSSYLEVDWRMLFIRNYIMQNPDIAQLSCHECSVIFRVLWDEYKAEVDAEIELMKTHHLNTITVHSFFVANERKLCHYVQNEAVKELCEQDCRRLFPMCSRKLEKQYRQGKERRTLEQKSFIVFKLFGICTLPEISKKVVNYLKIKDLKNLIEAGVLKLRDTVFM